MKAFDRFTTKGSYTWNITRNTENTALKIETLSLGIVDFAEETYKEEMDDDKRLILLLLLLLLLLLIIIIIIT